MRQIKLLVIFLFFGGFFAGFGSQIFSPKVKGQNSLSAPTGVIVSDGSYTTKIGLNWDAIRGATAYQIFRSTTNNPAAAASVGTSAANYFFDGSAQPGQNYFYWVRAQNAAGLSDFSEPDTGFRAVGTFRNVFPVYEPPIAPAENPVTAAKATLGKVLFWDEQLSSTRTVSCGTCHTFSTGAIDKRTGLQRDASRNPGLDGVFNTDDDTFGSAGVIGSNFNGSYNWSAVFGLRAQVTPRRALPPIDNGVAAFLFWDGRAGRAFRDPLTNEVIIQNGAALENVTLEPFLNTIEMGHAGRSWNDVVSRLNQSKPLALSPGVPSGLENWIADRSYAELFEESFGTPEITPVRIAMAIATYERTLFADRTPFDLYNQGLNTLTETELLGRGVMTGPIGRCNACHAGTMLASHAFRNTGVRPASEDSGRAGFTGDPNDLAAFRTPTLRNVELRNSFFHNGKFTTLEEVVEFYNRGGDFDAPNIDRGSIRVINFIPEHKAALLAFLKRPLTDPRVANETSPFDRPQLYSESNRVPQITGSGLAGSNNQTPKAIAVEPPLVGNPSFTVAVSNALGGVGAVLVINETDPGATTTIPASGSFARVAVTLQGSGAGNGYGSVSLAIPNNPAMVGKTFFGRWYVADAGAAGGVAVSQVFRFTIFGEASVPLRATHADFDGDGKTDVSVFRPSEGNWYILRSLFNNYSVTNFGLSGDRLAPADYDGDGKADVAVFRDGVWYILRSLEGVQIVQFGLAGDIPQPGDYDNDGKADIAVWRPADGVWYILRSRDGFTAAHFGLASDRPVAADYDGDGKTDMAIYRDGVWYLLQSWRGFGVVQFGLPEDKPVFGDYDADGRTDLAVYRPSNGVWYVLRSSDNGFSAVQFGFATDAPAPGDYDGDGKNDFAVFRASEGNWYIQQSSNGAVRVQNWGLNTDVSVPSAIVP